MFTSLQSRENKPYGKTSAGTYQQVSMAPEEVVLRVHYDVETLYQEHSGQLSPSTEVMFGEGWGLGLTMSQEIVERHGERVEVEVSGGKGVVCSVRLPFQIG